MIKKRLISIVPQSKKYIAANVLCQLVGLAASIVTVFAISSYLQGLWAGTPDVSITAVITIVLAAVAVRSVCLYLSSRTSYQSSKAVKLTLRQMITEKLLRLGRGYSSRTASSEVLQLAGEGAEQLETYFGAYLPQFFYAMIAPLCLFAAMCFISVLFRVSAVSEKAVQ